jgi:hypothetical protein
MRINPGLHVALVLAFFGFSRAPRSPLLRAKLTSFIRELPYGRFCFRLLKNKASSRNTALMCNWCLFLRLKSLV